MYILLQLLHFFHINTYKMYTVFYFEIIQYYFKEFNMVKKLNCTKSNQDSSTEDLMFNQRLI